MEESKQEIRRVMLITATTPLELHLILSSWKPYEVETIISILQVSNLLTQEPKLLFQDYTASQ